MSFYRHPMSNFVSDWTRKSFFIQKEVKWTKMFFYVFLDKVDEASKYETDMSQFFVILIRLNFVCSQLISDFQQRASMKNGFVLIVFNPFQKKHFTSRVLYSLNLFHGLHVSHVAIRTVDLQSLPPAQHQGITAMT